MRQKLIAEGEEVLSANGMKEVYSFIDKNSDIFLEEFREFVRKPGISTENTGIDETVSWLAKKMKEIGIDDVQVFDTQRHPVILGKVGTAAERTLLVYGHYDVQPPGDRKDWKVDPFAAEVVGDRIIGRGTCDMKNNLMASIHAVKAIIECRKSTPINLMFLFEGEEEIASPSFRPFVEKHKEELSACDSILCGDGGGENKDGQALLIYGLKGALSMELQAKSPSGVEIHSMFAGIVDNPAWRLISALRCLRENDRIVVPHFYDGVKEPNVKEKIKYGLARIVVNKKKIEEAFEIKIREDMNVSEAALELYYKPTLNINGLSSGYAVKGGIKTIVPDSAWARIDARLVPGQDPLRVFENVRKHLISKGFNDVIVEKQMELPAYRIDPDERIAKICREATKKVVNSKTTSMPIMPASGAMAWLPHILSKPMAFAGSGVTYMAHRPNEFITIDQYLKGIKLFATIYNDYA
jgi:acetylornithine deacetylase/succinyl-diaminopimelate desuccinylase-like protein